MRDRDGKERMRSGGEDSEDMEKGRNYLVEKEGEMFP